ncbi:GNAT family N-acetyltransferase [Actinomadura napierensis]|uniref:GNAT family N-acetyltransferase n=2 Tax=Actinomadura napierensis TaxID=267854 RepID=A0ABP5KG52_9ACTN
MGFMKQLNVRSVAHIAGATLDDVRIRPYGTTDRDRLVRMSARVSTASLYTRFFSGTPRIPDHYLAAMDRLDHWDREAMVGLVDGEMVGIAEYVRDVRAPGHAEIAVLVADPWQRRGLGSRLVGYLTQLAARRGITEFGADVILSNRCALLFVRNGWPAARSRTEEGAARFHLPLTTPCP